MSDRKVVFCDFDGTITAVETFAGMLKEFAPDLSAELMPLMYARKLTLRQGVRQILESIPSSRYPEMIGYTESKPIRPGLSELLDFLNHRDVPLVVISGGLRDMVEAVLRRSQAQNELPPIDKVASIFALNIDTTGTYLQVRSDFEEDTELVAKVKVMEQYPASQAIAIGDSLTDINMALKADVVFARDRLISYMEAENKPYIPWDDFFDVRDALEQMWQTNAVM